MKTPTLDLKSLFFIIIYTILSLFVSGCYMSSPPPLGTFINGHWQWVSTYNDRGHVIERPAPNASRFLSIGGSFYSIGGDLSGTAFDEVARFYNNGVQVDSLFRQITHQSITPSKIDEKNSTVFALYFDGESSPVMVRYKFFFPKRKFSPDRIQINIQRNTTTYNPAADTLVMEYRSIYSD